MCTCFFLLILDACIARQVRSLSLEVATKLLDVLVVQYPALREAVRSVAGVVMEAAYESALEEVDDLLAKEKDPFTVSAPSSQVLVLLLRLLFLYCFISAPFPTIRTVWRRHQCRGLVQNREGGRGLPRLWGSRECIFSVSSPEA